MANFCTWCSNHGMSIPYSFKHRQNCKYFRCPCSKCKGTSAYLKNVAIQRVSEQKQAAEREKRQREIERQKTAHRKRDAKQQNFPADRNAMERKQNTGNERSSRQKSSVRTQSIPSTSREQSFKPYCKLCRNHGLSYYYIGQHFKSCKYRTCSCRKCQETRGPAKSKPTKAADGPKKRSLKERSESPEGSSKRLCVENVDQPLPNCPFCLNHGFSFPLKAHHSSVCLHKNCSCDPCRDERKSTKERVTEGEEKEHKKSKVKEKDKSEEKDNNKSEDEENIKSAEEEKNKSEEKEKMNNAVKSAHLVTALPTDLQKPCAVVAPKPRLCAASFSTPSALEAHNYQENNNKKLSEKGADMPTLGLSDSTAAGENIGTEKTASPEEKTSESNISGSIHDVSGESPEVSEIQGVTNSFLHEEETTSETDAPELTPDVDSENGGISETQLSEETCNSSVYSETFGIPEVLDEEYRTVSEASESSHDEGSNMSLCGEEANTKVTEEMGTLSIEGSGSDTVMIESNIVPQVGKTLSVENSAHDTVRLNKCKDYVEDPAVVGETQSKSDLIENSFGKVGEGSEEQSMSENGIQAIVPKPMEDLSNNGLKSQGTSIPLSETDLPQPKPKAIEGNLSSTEARIMYDGDSCNEETNAIKNPACISMGPTHSAPQHISTEENKSSELFSEVSGINGISNEVRSTNSPSLNNSKTKDCKEKAGYQEPCLNQETPIDASNNSTLMADLMAELVTLEQNWQSALPLSRSVSVSALETSLFDEIQPFDSSSHLQKSSSHSHYGGTPPSTAQPASEMVQENGSEGMPIVSTPACVKMTQEKPKESLQEGPESVGNPNENFEENPETHQKPTENSLEDPESCSKETDSNLTQPAHHLVEDATLPQESTNTEEITISQAELASESFEVDLQKECDVCGKVFSASTNLRLHQFLKHDVDCESTPGTMYHCRECPYENEKEIATLDHESSHMALVPLERMLKLFCVISNGGKKLNMS